MGVAAARRGARTHGGAAANLKNTNLLSVGQAASTASLNAVRAYVSSGLRLLKRASSQAAASTPAPIASGMASCSGTAAIATGLIAGRRLRLLGSGTRRLLLLLLLRGQQRGG